MSSCKSISWDWKISRLEIFTEAPFNVLRELFLFSRLEGTRNFFITSSPAQCIKYSIEMELETCEKVSIIRGYHVYQAVWTAAIGEELLCKREAHNATTARWVGYIVHLVAQSERISESTSQLVRSRWKAGKTSASCIPCVKSEVSI